MEQLRLLSKLVLQPQASHVHRREATLELLSPSIALIVSFRFQLVCSFQAQQSSRFFLFRRRDGYYRVRREYDTMIAPFFYYGIFLPHSAAREFRLRGLLHVSFVVVKTKNRLLDPAPYANQRFYPMYICT